MPRFEVDDILTLLLFLSYLLEFYYILERGLTLDVDIGDPTIYYMLMLCMFLWF